MLSNRFRTGSGAKSELSIGIGAEQSLAPDMAIEALNAIVLTTTMIIVYKGWKLSLGRAQGCRWATKEAA